MHTLVSLLGALLISFAPVTLGNALPHAFHVSKCLIEYNSAESAIQISLHLFIDDTEAALRLQGFDHLNMCTDKEAESADQHLEAYLTKHLRLEVDGKSVQAAYLGKEATEDLAGMWCYLEITGISDIGELTIDNDILMDAFPDQKNIVNVIGPRNHSEMFLFQKGESREKLAF
ncbi:MAG: DUF6702 family protein [Saprospiraceae bacterium]|nr:hypothetical protein [Lewinella sp.]